MDHGDLLKALVPKLPYRIRIASKRTAYHSKDYRKQATCLNKVRIWDDVEEYNLVDLLVDLHALDQSVQNTDMAFHPFPGWMRNMRYKLSENIASTAKLLSVLQRRLSTWHKGLLGSSAGRWLGLFIIADEICYSGKG